MQKFKIAFLLSIILTIIASCGPKLGPRIDFANNSANCKMVYNVRVNWNGYPLKVSRIGIDGGSSQSHYIKNFFGPIHVTWENEKKEKLTKSFTFTKKDMPSYSSWPSATGEYVILYFNQNDMTYLSFDHPDFKKEKRKLEGDWFMEKVFKEVNGEQIYQGRKCTKNAKKKWRKPDPEARNYRVNWWGKKIYLD